MAKKGLEPWNEIGKENETKKKQETPKLTNKAQNKKNQRLNSSTDNNKLMQSLRWFHFICIS